MLGLAMALPTALDYYDGVPEWRGFAFSSGATIFVGTNLYLVARGAEQALGRQQAFALTTFSWVVLTAFAALPFVWSALSMSYTDAFFEAMSGITTTGATVIPDLDHASRGLKLWRALLQWLGGIGIIVMAIAVLPMLQVGGMQLFRLESSDRSDKMLPRATQIASSIGLIYFALSVVCAAAYALAGMPIFESIAHAMTTMSTGGFSTHTNSIAEFEGGWIKPVAIVFMVIGALPFTLYLYVSRGHVLTLAKDTQVRWYVATLAISIAAIYYYVSTSEHVEQRAHLLDVAFNVISLSTGTGYATADYGLWGSFSVYLLFCLMLIGGCSGSASCGIKVFRFQIIFSALHGQIGRLFHPHGVFIMRYNKRPVTGQIVESVAAFFFLFFALFVAMVVTLSLMGLDLVTAYSATAAMIANVGPGFGDIIGPTGSFADIPADAKWVMSLAMLLGRLELFTVLVMLTPAFWRI